MKKSKLIIGVAVVLIGLPVLAVGAVYALVDPNDYRAQIAEALSKQLGRNVELKGPIKLGLSWSNGIDLSVSDVTVANPSWASRPLLAKIGALNVGVGLQPLLQKKLSISEFKLADADIQLETSASDQTNYDFKSETATPAPTSTPSDAKPDASSASMQIDKVSIDNSKLAMRGKDGKIAVYTVKSLSLDNTGNGVKVNFSGDAAGAAVKLDLTGGTLQKITSAKWPFTADVTYANYDLHAIGNLENGGKGVTLSSYTVSAGNTKLTGQMTVKLGGSHPVIDGTLTSEKLDLADLKPPATEGSSGAAAPAPAAQDGKHLFSDAPINLDGLKAANAKLDISIGEMPLGAASVKQLRTTLELGNGRLTLSPLAMVYAGSAVQGNVTVDASGAPAQIRMTIKAPQLDMAELANGAMKGKADADLNINTSGRSLHDFASNADGTINFISDGGSMPSSTLSLIGGNLLNAVAAGAGSSKLNCLAARFKLQQGQMQSDGLLVDTDQATLLGNGNINLRDENLNMLLKTRTKAVKIDAFTPAIRISGGLLGPRFAPDTASTVQKVAGMIMGGDARTAAADNGVPEVVAVAGQNACVYTLDHPTAAKPAAAAPTGSTLQDAVNGKAKLKDVGNSLLKGIFGK